MPNPFSDSGGFDEPERSAQLRAAHVLMLAIRLLGSTDQVRALRHDARDLDVPVVRRRGPGDSVEPLDRALAERELVPQEEVDRATERTLRTLGLGGAWQTDGAVDGVLGSLWDHIRATRSRPATYALLDVAARSRDQLVATASATALLRITGTSPLARGIAQTSARSQDPLVQGLGRAALAHGHELPPVLVTTAPSSGGSRTPPPDLPAPPRRHLGPVSACVHGTWARHAAERWYTPRARLFQHIKGTATPSLYDAHDYFRWSAGYTGGARDAGASDLIRWSGARTSGELDTVFAHSHGGNVALQAAARGQRIRLLVLLHTPVSRHGPETWDRIAAHVGRIVALRSRADLVMLADNLLRFSTLEPPRRILRGGAVKPHPADRSAYFAHDYYLREKVWIDHDIASDITFERSLA